MGNGEHLRMKLKQNGSLWDAVGFGMGDCIKNITSPTDIVFNLELDNWNGRETLRLNIQDMGGIK
jgi:single-stranded-DNA-specific exonuclease